MSLFLACLIAAIAFLASLLVAMSEQIRVALSHRNATAGDEQTSCDVALAGPHFAVSQSTCLPQNAVKGRVSAAMTEARAAVYRQVLDQLGDDLDQDIAEWEAVLQEFPQVLFPDDLSIAEDRLGRQNDIARPPVAPLDDHISPPLRSRKVDLEDRSMIVRLSKTGFAAEEIALLLNLPLERVHEVLSRP